VSEPVEKYMVALVFATRYPDRYNADLAKLLQVGVSPRGVIGLDRMSRSYAWLRGRDFVTPDDVKAIVHDVFRHRLLLSYEAHASNTTPDQIIDRITELVAVS
jgi:MoxR-like ATPase